MADIDLKTETPDTTLPTTGFLFGADSQAAASPSVFTVQSVATTLLGSTTLTGATVTTSSPVIDAAQTWNAGGVTFTGLKFNATDTASAAASLLMDLQTGGTSRFYVGKTGRANVFDLNCWDGDLVIYRAGTAAARIGTANGSFTGLAMGTNVSVPDLFLTRRGAANLRFGAADAAAPVAQTLSVQSVVAGTTNTAGANLTITGSQGTGTGAGGSIIFQVAPAGSSGTAQNALADVFMLSATPVDLTYGRFFGGFTVRPDTGTNSGALLTASALRGFNGGTVTIGSSAGVSNDNIAAVYLRGTAVVAWEDTILRRDAANTLAQRNGANAQAFRVYNTFTDASNYERFAVDWSSNVVRLGAQAEGSGSLRALRIGTFELGSGGQSTIGAAVTVGVYSGKLQLYDINLQVGTATGTKIGTATNEKLGFWNATPVVQPTAVADATDAATVITQLNALLSRMRTIGLIAT